MRRYYVWTNIIGMHFVYRWHRELTQSEAIGNYHNPSDDPEGLHIAGQTFDRTEAYLMRDLLNQGIIRVYA